VANGAASRLTTATCGSSSRNSASCSNNHPETSSKPPLTDFSPYAMSASR
jgi:hypothetical protein